MYIYGIILIVAGLGLIFLPDQMAATWGTSGISGFARFAEEVTGATFLTAGISGSTSWLVTRCQTSTW